MKYEFYKVNGAQWFTASFSKYGWFKPAYAILWQYNGEVGSDVFYLNPANNYSFVSSIWGSNIRIEVTYRLWFFSFTNIHYLEVPVQILPPTNLHYEILGVTNG